MGKLLQNSQVLANLAQNRVYFSKFAFFGFIFNNSHFSHNSRFSKNIFSNSGSGHAQWPSLYSDHPQIKKIRNFRVFRKTVALVIAITSPGPDYLFKVSFKAAPDDFFSVQPTRDPINVSSNDIRRMGLDLMVGEKLTFRNSQMNSLVPSTWS